MHLEFDPVTSSHHQTRRFVNYHSSVLSQAESTGRTNHPINSDMVLHPACYQYCSEVRTDVLGAAAALDQEERWTVEKVVKMHKEGVTVSKVLEEPQRRMLLRKEVDKRLSDGKGEY